MTIHKLVLHRMREAAADIRRARVLAALCGALAVACTNTAEPTTQGASTTDIGTTSGDTVTPTSSGTSESPTSSGGSSSSGGGLDLEQCDAWAQDCPQGYKCMAYAEEGEPAFTGTKCTPVVTNPATAGEPCSVEGGWWTGVDDCDYGHACWHIDHSTNTGVCIAQCVGNSDAPGCPEADEVCVFWTPGLAHVCMTTCDPLLQDCEGADQLCLPNYASDAKEWVCQRDYGFEEGQEFDPCQYANVCDPGLLCMDASGATECDAQQGYCCLAICDLSDPQCNGEGAVCEPFYRGDSAPPKYANVGVCGLPG